jgi:hypothetical protein
MAPARGVAEPLSAKLACADLLWLIEDSAWPLWKNGYTGPSRADRLPDLHILHLMHEERFQPLFLTFIYFKRKQARGRII